MGRDRFGLWAEFAVQDQQRGPINQRLRWIPPGRFLMGSPEGEPGRYNDEGPQRPVSIQRGFWLFDTPCTQALWVVVMGDNPSRFKSPQRPVEQVGWEDVQLFMQRLNTRIPGLDLTLPSEAQWEYACRAGTDTALYSGGIEILGKNNALALDAIAWYGGNSGVDFELADGWDSSKWEEMQYPNSQSGSHAVGQKRPNPLGLRDMLGNVWEWTLDNWHDSYQGAPENGEAWLSSDAGGARVVRGGSWISKAGICRCACRDLNQPDFRNNGLGFRCARVQA
jgi:formylglycine-generating enzyme required for sulfatase activity